MTAARRTWRSSRSSGATRRASSPASRTYLAACNSNIEDIEQRVVEGLFIMTMVVDLADVTVYARRADPRPQGRSAPRCSSRSRCACTASGVRKRIAVLVSREPHCLQQLIADQAAGLIAGDFVCVLSNHELLRPIAEAAGIPFEWRAGRPTRPRTWRGCSSACARTGPIWSCWPATCRSSTPGAGRAVPQPHHQHPPVAAAVPPGRQRL